MSAFTVFFCWVLPWPRSPLLPRVLRVPSVLLPATPVSPPRAPSLARSPPLPFSVSQPTLPAMFVCPLCLSRAVTRVCQPRALPLPLSVIPTLFPGVSPTLVLFPRSLSLTSSWKPCALCVCVGVYLRSGLWPCPRTGMTLAVGFLRTMSHRIFRRNTERTTERTFADFPSLHLQCGPAASSRRDQLRRFCTELLQSDQSPQTGACPHLVTKGSHLVALLRKVFHGANCHQRPGAFRVGRGQTLTAGHA